MASGYALRHVKPASFAINAYKDEMFWYRWCLGCGWDPEQTTRDYSQFISPSNSHNETAARGGLDVLPLEITQIILHKLDLESLESIRQLNPHHQAAVESLHTYSLLKQHASHTLEVIWRTEMAKHIQLDRLFAEFVQPSCRGCGAFGPLIFLPTVQRCCQKCLRDNMDFWVIDSLSLHQFDPNLSTAGSLLPVVHCPEVRCPHREICSLFLLQKCVSAAQAGSIAPQVRDYLRRWKEPATQPVWVPVYRSSMRVFCGVHGATDLPFWDPQTQEVETGVYCCACSGAYLSELWAGFPVTPAFTQDTIPQHFEECRFNHQGYVPSDRLRTHVQYTPSFWVSEKGKLLNPDTGVTDGC